MTLLLDGKATSAKVQREVAARVVALRSKNVEPTLALVRVGDDPASESYVRSKAKLCAEVGIRSEMHEKPADFSQGALLSLIADLNARDDVHGILVQMPLPAGLDALAVQCALDPTKDVDGLHPENAGRIAMGLPGFVPCTPLGVQRLLVDHAISISGAHVVVVGRSHLVGRPLASLLSGKGPNADATVTLCHSQTRDLPAMTRRADILVAAIGRPRFVTGDMVREGAVVVDVGIHRVGGAGTRRLQGDVAFDEVASKVRAISPVPGGVGPMTVVMLLSNTVDAAERRWR
jgi:methylenetetrahydrofolate dehydrogenase (NADP+)/methenyltetrahydrofolate cyclohydrolase